MNLGFKWRSNGSHYTYTKGSHVIGIVKRSGKPVKRVYVDNLNDLLRQLEAEKAEATNKEKEQKDQEVKQ